MESVGLYLCNEKGLAVLRAALESGVKIAHVTYAEARGMNDNSHHVISSYAKEQGIPTFLLRHPPEYNGDCSIAAGWRWMLDVPNLIVLHDSLLPKYRGHAPLVTALIKREREVGVTAFQAVEEVDAGPILMQSRLKVSYPAKIRHVLNALLPLYESMAYDICLAIKAGESLATYEQNHEHATYSPWRDEEDYRIDWTWGGDKICRLIDAVSDPFPGAWTFVKQAEERQFTRVYEAERAYVKLADRQPGKVLKVDERGAWVMSGDDVCVVIKSSYPEIPNRTRLL